MVIGQVLGSLPSQEDWLNPRTIKIACFVLGTIQVCVKGCEMFFNKTAAMFKSHELTLDEDKSDSQQQPQNKP